MDEEQRALEELIRKMQDASASSEDFARANKAAESALTKFAKATISDVTKGVTAFGGSVMSGNRSFQTLTPLVDALGTAMSGLVGAIPVAGKAFAGMTKAAVEASKFLIDQLQGTLDSFQQVSQVGAIGVEGMEAFRQQAFGSMMTLEQFGQAVEINSQTLARFGGATFASMNQFADAIGEIAGENGFARRLGRSTSDIAETTAKFMEMQTIQGRQQIFTGDALRRGTEDYILDLDRLARLTGQSARELQDQQLALMLDQQFAAFTGNLGEQGQLLAQSTGPLADGFKDIIATGGAATTDAGRQLQVLLGGAANDIANSLRSADDIPGAIANVRSILEANLEIPRTAAAAGVQNFLTDNFGAIQQFARGLTLSNEEIEASRQRQLQGTDTLITALVGSATKIDDFAANLDSVIIKALPAAAQGLEVIIGKMNEGLELFTQKIPNLVDLQMEKIENMSVGNILNMVTGKPQDSQDGFKFLDRIENTLMGAGVGAAAGAVGGLGFGAIPGMIAGGLMGFFGTDVQYAVQDMFKYAGGPVSAGKPYVVGEKGPEIMVPDTDGMVMPNSMLAGPITGFNAMDVPAPQPVQEVTIPASVTRTQESQGNAQMEMMQTQINKLDEMIRLMGRQITATDKVRTAVS